MKARDRVAVTALRSLLAALDNASAVPVGDATPVVGRSGDVSRRHLSEEDTGGVLQREVEERRAAVAEYERLGQDEAARRLRDELAVIARHTPSG